MSIKELNVLLAKAQSDRATKEAALTYSDFAAIGNEFELTFKQSVNDLPITTASFGKHARVPGMAGVDLKATTYLSDNGSSAPMFEKWLMSCGFGLSQAGDVRTYAPTSTQSSWTYLTAWGNTGTKLAANSVITKAYSMLCDGTIDFAIGEPAKLSLTGKGVADGAPACGNYVSGTLALPTDTIPVMMACSSMAAMGFSWDILKGSVAFKNQVELVKEIDSTFPFGYRYADISDRDFEIKLSVYQTTDLPYPALGAGTLGSFNIAFGATGAKVRIYSPSSSFQITDVAPGADGGQNTFEITGTIQYEDFAVKTGE